MGTKKKGWAHEADDIDWQVDPIRRISRRTIEDVMSLAHPGIEGGGGKLQGEQGL